MLWFVNLWNIHNQIQVGPVGTPDCLCRAGGSGSCGAGSHCFSFSPSILSMMCWQKRQRCGLRLWMDLHGLLVAGRDGWLLHHNPIGSAQLWPGYMAAHLVWGEEWPGKQFSSHSRAANNRLFYSGTWKEPYWDVDHNVKVGRGMWVDFLKWTENENICVPCKWPLEAIQSGRDSQYSSGQGDLLCHHQLIFFSRHPTTCFIGCGGRDSGHAQAHQLCLTLIKADLLLAFARWIRHQIVVTVLVH